MQKFGCDLPVFSNMLWNLLSLSIKWSKIGKQDKI